jgi:hypothetical protein
VCARVHARPVGLAPCAGKGRAQRQYVAAAPERRRRARLHRAHAIVDDDVGVEAGADVVFQDGSEAGQSVNAPTAQLLEAVQERPTLSDGCDKLARLCMCGILMFLRVIAIPTLGLQPTASKSGSRWQ